VGGWRQCWLTKPAPEDPEPGERSTAMTGACLTVSQVQSISLVCGTIIYSAVASDIGVCHADCHEGDWLQSHMRSGLQKCERPSLPGGKRRAQASGQAIGLLSTLCSPVWMGRVNNRIV